MINISVFAAESDDDNDFEKKSLRNGELLITLVIEKLPYDVDSGSRNAVIDIWESGERVLSDTAIILSSGDVVTESMTVYGYIESALQPPTRTPSDMNQDANRNDKSKQTFGTPVNNDK